MIAQCAPQLNHRKRSHARSTAGSAAMKKTAKTSRSSSPSSSTSSTIQTSTKGATTSSASSSVKNPPPIEPSPVKFLYKLFGTSEQGRRIISKRSLSSPPLLTWEKPSQEALDAYDLSVVQAIREGNIDALRKMLQEGKSMNACNKFGESILSMACRRGHVETVKFLVTEANVKINMRDDFGRLPYHDTCWTAVPNEKVMDILLTVSSPELLIEKDVRGHTPFHYARREHWDDWVKFLEGRSDKLLKALEAQDATCTSAASSN
jgi:Ankyrin repeats (many copies)